MKDSRNVRILAVGDIIGGAGRRILSSKLQGIKDLHKIDFVIANGENAAGGISITPGIAEELFDMGVDVLTTGNHVWDKKEAYEILGKEPSLLRPANYPDGNPGAGYYIYNFKSIKICVINLQGRILMLPIDCPFKKFDQIYSEIKDKADVIIIDFHAEATSEKRALGWYVDGRASAIFGTHTHVQTADEEILPGGTGYITDIGMTGPFDSVIGMDKELAIRRFLTQTKERLRVASENSKINGIIITINYSGNTEDISRLIE